MPRISEDTIQRVAAASDVVAVIGSYLQLKRAGSNWKGLCPFHNEKSPSFHVNPARQTFKCFGCGAGGSVFRFIMDYENVDFPGAVRRLGARAGVPVEEESAGDEVRRGERDRLLALHRDAAAWFHENLMRQKFGAHAREYLKGRGIGSDVAARWQLGYAPDSWDALTAALRARAYSSEEILKSGLVILRDEQNPKSKIENPKSYDRFRNRVMFPICNDYGEVIGFSGRTLGDDPAKYVNSPETPIFTKGGVLFGLEKTKRAIIEANEAVVCEGQLDLISAFEAGVQNVTAPQGTAFTSKQARLLRRFAESAVLCFDSDAAGRKAVERSLPALLAVGLGVRVARVPAGEDPDSLVRNHGADALRAVVAEARDYFDDVLTEELLPGAPPRQRAALARKLAGFVRIIEDPALREAVTLRLRSRLELTDAAFAALMKSAPRPDADRESEEADIDVVELSEPARLMCRLALDSLAAREWIRGQPGNASDFGPDYALVDKLAMSSVLAADGPAFAAFRAGLPAAEERALANVRVEHLSSSLPEDPVAVLADAWRSLARRKIQAGIAAIHSRMRHPDTSPDEVASLHKQILDLQKSLGQV
ncbi:MAG: DNA primase [Terrimicrobiaceae bacterium]|nr:DNA primase [Terrimicrobiaceae bacterium]